MRIGFVDHHLNNYHANKFLALLQGELGARVVSAWESHPTGDDWCVQNAVPRAESPAAVAAAADAVIVLAPDNIDAHPDLCRQVFPAGKPVMVDKFLAPNLHEAREIVEMAEQRSVRLFSASGLRFAVEMEAALAEAGEAPSQAFARGMGAWDGYGVHTLSLVVAALGADYARLIDTGTDTSTTVTLAYEDGRRGWLDVREAANQWEALPWAFGFKVGDRYVTGTVADFDGFYAALMRRAVEFFRTGESPVSTEEMLGIVGVLEGARRSRELGGQWSPCA